MSRRYCGPSTPADVANIRPYFNAGHLVVRPESGVLRKWAACFPVLYEDKVFADWCRKDVRKRIFLHQVALVGAVLTTLKRDEVVEFSSAVNYPLFHDERSGWTNWPRNNPILPHPKDHGSIP